MKIICNKKLKTFKSKKGNFDLGLFEISKDFLFCNRVHGSKNGTLWIEAQRDVVFEVEFINWFRTQLLTLFNQNDHDQIILINPCYPNSVLDRYGKELEKQKIKVLTWEKNSVSMTDQEEGTLNFLVDWGRGKGTAEVIRTITKPEDVLEYLDEL